MDLNLYLDPEMATAFNQILHADFVTRHGEEFTWFRAVTCPCVIDGDRTRPSPICNVCNGEGRVFLAGSSKVGIITDVRREKSLIEAGLLQPGDLKLGMSPLEGDDQMISPGDQVEISWSQGQPVESEVLTRDIELGVDRLKFPVRHVFSCLSVDSEAGTSTVYGEGVHFTVSGQLVTWINVVQPPPGTKYSIAYAANHRWDVFEPTQDRRETGDNLPQ